MENWKKLIGFLKLNYLKKKHKDKSHRVFKKTQVEFHYLDVNNVGKKMKLDKRKVIDDVSGLADNSNKCGRKFIKSLPTVTFIFSI